MEDFAFGQSVESKDDNCFGAVDTIPYLDSANSIWKEIDVDKLRFAMRTQYMKSQEDNSLKIKNLANQYTHKKIGQSIKDILNDG
jgi:hypothetical protein